MTLTQETFEEKLQHRNIQIADLKNKLLKAQERCFRLEDRIKDLQEVDKNQLEEINKFLGELIKAQKEIDQIRELKKFKDNVRNAFMNTMFTPQEFIGEIEKLLNR